MSSAHEDRLQARLDVSLPRELAVGAGTALFVCGTCFHRDQRIHSLSLLIDGAEQPVIAHQMPRLDYFRTLHPGIDPYDAPVSADPGSLEDPRLHSYLSGFWAIAELQGGRSGSCEIGLRARLADGGEAVAELARIDREELPSPPPSAPRDPESGPLVAISMATHEAPLDLFRRQIDSIREQTHHNWICLISDDCSSPARFAAMREELGEDPRFVVSRSPRRLGFYRNFERALTMVPVDADYVALCDQDDFWFPDKLESLLAAIGDAQLAYSDARLISRDGALLSDTYWSRRRNNHTDLLSLLVANSVSGAASLFRRDLLALALPFPPAQFAHFHDHWIALTALSLGDIAFVERPLYDYVQHGEAALGHAGANRMRAFRDRLGSLRTDPSERVRMWRLHYFVDVARLTQCATILRMRCGERLAPAKRRALERFLRADASRLALADLWRRGARELIGRPETLGAEWMLAYAFSWRRLLAASARERPTRRLRLDAVPPPDLVIPPGRQGADSPVVTAIAEKVSPLGLGISDLAVKRVNLLIPTIDLAHFFGGYIGKFNLARRLAERGMRVRIVTVDPVGRLPARWKQKVESYHGLAGLFDEVEVVFGRESHELEVSPEDSFIASTWWTAHTADAAVRKLGREGFLYLIQEYEPFTFPMGTYAALARQSYDFPHRALFSTELLREYFSRHGIGVYATGQSEGAERSASFQNAITAIEPPTAGELAAREPHRLLFYSRPEAHASRNLYELGVLALQRALEQGVFGSGWELHGIGTINGTSTVRLAAGAMLQLLPRSDQGAYARLLRRYDLGLALMYTPHPSLVPIEMASAGMLTVTNSFENKTEAAMRAISSNLLAPAPTVEGVAGALARAAGAIDDYDRRIAGSSVNWSRDWSDSFGDRLIERVIALLEQ